MRSLSALTLLLCALLLTACGQDTEGSAVDRDPFMGGGGQSQCTEAPLAGLACDVTEGTYCPYEAVCPCSGQRTISCQCANGIWECPLSCNEVTPCAADVSGDAGDIEPDGDATEDTSSMDTQLADTEGVDTTPAEDTTPPPSPATCAEYCQSVTQACVGEYVDQGSCEAFCADAALPAGMGGDVAGDSVTCRFNQTDCAAAGAGSDGTCGDWCDVYCRLAQAHCTGVDELFASDGDCQTACAAFATTGAAGDATGDTVQCRVTALGVGSTTCSEGAPSGSVACQ